MKKKERGDMNEDKYSVNEDDSLSCSDEQRQDDYLEEEFFKPREEKEMKRKKSQVKYRPKNKRRRSSQGPGKNMSRDGTYEDDPSSVEPKRKMIRVNSKEKKMKKCRSRKRSKKNSIALDELPKIGATANEIMLEERHTTKTRSNNRSKKSSKYNFKDLFNNPRRKNYEDIKKKVFSKSNGNKKKKAVKENTSQLYNANQSFKKGSSLRNWKKNMFISTDNRKEKDMGSSPPRMSKNHSKTTQGKDSKGNKNFLSKMLKKMMVRSNKNKTKKSPRINFRKDYVSHQQGSMNYQNPNYSYFSNNGSSRRKSSKDRKNQFFMNPNYSMSVNASKAHHRRNFSKQDFVTYIDSPMYTRNTGKSSKSKDYKIREMSYDTGSGKGGKKLYKRQKSKQRLSSRQKPDRVLDLYKSKKIKMRNMKLRKKMGALRSKKQ